MTYAEIYARLIQAKKAGAHVVIDTDPGMFRLTADQALELFAGINPGEAFVWVDITSPDAARAHDLTTLEVGSDHV